MNLLFLLFPILSPTPLDVPTLPSSDVVARSAIERPAPSQPVSCELRQATRGGEQVILEHVGRRHVPDRGRRAQGPDRPEPQPRKRRHAQGPPRPTRPQGPNDHKLQLVNPTNKRLTGLSAPASMWPDPCPVVMRSDAGLSACENIIFALKCYPSWLGSTNFHPRSELRLLQVTRV